MGVPDPGAPPPVGWASVGSTRPAACADPAKRPACPRSGAAAYGLPHEVDEEPLQLRIGLHLEQFGRRGDLPDVALTRASPTGFGGAAPLGRHEPAEGVEEVLPFGPRRDPIPIVHSSPLTWSRTDRSAVSPRLLQVLCQVQVLDGVSSADVLPTGQAGG